MIIAWSLSLLPSSLALSSASPFGRTAKNVATQILQGAGPASVDLNQYNVDLSRIVREWTVTLVQSVNEQNARVVPAVKSQDLYVDTVTVAYKRRRNAGLGIELEELLGGRGDGIGITLISGVAPGGPLDGGYDVLAGDMLAQVAVVSRGRSTNSETEREVLVRTECLDYEATVDAVRSLPEQRDDDEDIVLTLMRVRRKPKVKVTLQYPPAQGDGDATIELFAGENLRLGMLVRGVKLNDPLAKRFDTKNGGNCGAGGLCRTCAVSVVQGQGLLNEQSVAERQMLQDAPRWRLACKAIVGYGMQEGEMTIRVNPRQW
jgi:2Fe-2S iron-sulfur cluster binding domain